MLLNFSQHEAMRLRGLLGPAAGQTQTGRTGPQPIGPLILARALTPLVPDAKEDQESGNAAEVELLGPDPDDAPYDRSTLYKDIVSQTSSTITISGDWSKWIKEGSQIRVIDSTSNNDFYRLTAAPTYDAGPDETTLSFSPTLPDADTADGKVARHGPWGVIASASVHTVSGLCGVAAMPGDVILMTKIGGELVPVTGCQVLFAQVKEGEKITAPTIDSEDDDKLTLGSGEVEVYYFDSDGVRTGTGITVKVWNDWDRVEVDENYTIAAEWFGRWMLTQASCNETGATLA